MCLNVIYHVELFLFTELIHLMWDFGNLNYDWFVLNFRSGSVCLDVINQTWSPMFGNN